jgi:hypothetical protein
VRLAAPLKKIALRVFINNQMLLLVLQEHPRRRLLLLLLLILLHNLASVRVLQACRKKKTSKTSNRAPQVTHRQTNNNPHLVAHEKPSLKVP